MRPRIAIGRSYKPLVRSKYPFVLVEGPRGTSKTRTILSILLARAIKYDGCRILLFREHRSELTKTILTTLEDEVFPAFGMPVPGGAHRENRSEYVLHNGSTLFLAGLHEGSGALSMGMTFAYGAEVLQMSERQVVNVAGCLRWTQSPERPLLPDFAQLICDENPGPPGHWANKKAEAVVDTIRRVRTREDYDQLQQHNATPPADGVHRWKRIVTKIQDNPGYWDHKTWDFTPLGRRYVTETLGTLSGYQRLRWIDGLHVAAEGTVFPEFQESRNVCNPFDIPPDWPIYLFNDPGYAHPTALIWIAVAPNGCYYVFDEILEGGKGVIDHAKSIHAHNHGRTVVRYYADPRHAFSSTAQSPKSIATQYKDLGIRFTPWPRIEGPDVEPSVEAVRSRLTTAMLKVFETCRGTIDQLQSWRYKHNAKGELLKGDDAFEDANNDTLDCIRGAVALNLKPTRYNSEVRDQS